MSEATGVPAVPPVPIRRVLVTGAAGFIGSAVSARWRSLGAEVVGVDRISDPSRGIVGGDVSTPGAWQELASDVDLVVHTAAIVSNAVDRDEQWRVNVLGTRLVVDATRRARVPRLLHFSSVRAFSDLQFPEDVDERWPVRPDGSAYVDTKVASEQVVLQAHAAGEVAVTVLRPADVYGPGSRPWTITPVELIRAGRFLLPARGRGLFSPLYIDNLLDAVVLAATSPRAVGQVFTISDGRAVTCAEFFGHYARMLGRRIPLVPTPVALAVAAAVDAGNRARGRRTETNPESVRYFTRRSTYSIEKARHLLGYAPAIPLEEGMRRTEEWLREHGYLAPPPVTSADR